MRIKVATNPVTPPSKSISSTSSPSLPVTISNQLSCFFIDANKDEACADSRVTINQYCQSRKINNRILVPHGPRLVSFQPPKVSYKHKNRKRRITTPSATYKLYYKQNIAHKMPFTQKLFSLGVQANNNMVSMLEK